MIKKIEGLWMDEAFQIGWILKIWNIANTCSLKDDQCGKKSIFLKLTGTKKAGPGQLKLC
jgi:hypothetical protein